MRPLVWFWENYMEFNIRKATGIDLEINKVIAVVAIGFCVSCFLLNIKQARIASLMRKLIRRDAFSEQSAVTLKKIGLDTRAYQKMLKSKEGVLKSLVRTVGDERPTDKKCPEFEKKNNTDTASDNQIIAADKENPQKTVLFTEGNLDCEKSPGSESIEPKESVPESKTETEQKYYIPFESKGEAMKILSRNDSSILKASLGSILILGCATFLIFMMPVVVSLISSMVSFFTK